jgi:hypothetical protein
VACEPQAGCFIVSGAAGKIFANIVFTNKLNMESEDMNVHATDSTFACCSVCDSDV